MKSFQEKMQMFFFLNEEWGCDFSKYAHWQTTTRGLEAFADETPRKMGYDHAGFNKFAYHGWNESLPER